jgi:hypothetical protein
MPESVKPSPEAEEEAEVEGPPPGPPLEPPKWSATLEMWIRTTLERGTAKARLGSSWPSMSTPSWKD